MPVYELKINNKNISYIKNEYIYASKFKEEEKQRIIELWNAYQEVSTFNSICVAVESMKILKGEVILELGFTDFYNLLICNIIRQDFEEFKSFVIKNKIDKDTKLIDELGLYYSSFKSHYENLQDLINNGKMPNALAISVLLKDIYGNILLVKRSNKVGIGKDLYCVSVTGTVDENDFCSEDPILNCVEREIYEELGLPLDTKNIRIKAIVASAEKLQPTVIVNILVSFDLRILKQKQIMADDFSFENENIFILKKEQIENMLSTEKFSEISKYHLLSES